MKWSAYQRVQQIGAVLHDTATWLDGLARTQSRIVRRDALRQAATFASELQLELVVLDDEALRIKAECFDAACTVVDSVGNDSDHLAEIEALLGVARDRIRGLGERDAGSVGKRLPSDEPSCSGRITWLKAHGCEALAGLLNCTAAEVDAALSAIYQVRALVADGVRCSCVAHVLDDDADVVARGCGQHPNAQSRQCEHRDAGDWRCIDELGHNGEHTTPAVQR